jgi:SAM-dependent methyltransferase
MSVGLDNGASLEIGSGGGFLKEIFPEVITSDILPLPDVDRVVRAEALPFPDQSLSCILLLNVFHHIPKPADFLAEASRTLANGGKIMMVEPANTPFGRFIYKRFHHEPFDELGGRELPEGNPLGHANQALPYIYFERDIDWFRQQFPSLSLLSIRYHSPFTYLLSGGFSHRSFVPSFFVRPLEILEGLLAPLHPYLGLFCTITLERKA